MRGTFLKRSIGGLKYAVALRAIGQDLAGLSIETTEITVQDNVFVAQGRSIGPAQPFARKYSAEDIYRLDEMGAAQQKGVLPTPDATSLAEALRIVGKAVDDKKGRLIKLAKDQRKITFEYEDENGVVQKDDLYSLSAYKSQQEGLALRGTQKKTDVWEDGR
ncbi:MAG: hypothetical protein ACREQP_02665 [Candidatus Binatia bacterium]